VRRIRERFFYVSCAILAVLISACATSTQTMASKDASTIDRPPFKNILVIGVANDYEGRTRFERNLAKELTASGMSASPMYVAAGGNRPFTREAIEELVEANGYDAVLISRVLERDTDTSTKSGSSVTKAVRRNDRPVDLFRYDYEELNEPVTMDINLSVRILTELFAAADNERIWALESMISKKKTLEDVINEASEKIVRRLKRDGVIGR